MSEIVIVIEHCYCGEVISAPPAGWTVCPRGHDVQVSDGK